MYMWNGSVAISRIRW